MLLLAPPLATGSGFHCAADGATLQQLRIYELDRGNSGHFHARFRDHTLRIMARHGFRIADMWESDTAGKLQLVYVLEWPDAATMERQWAAFMADQEWADIKRRSAAEHGRLVEHAGGQPLVRLSYSPACMK